MVRRLDSNIALGEGLGLDSKWWLACCLACFLASFFPLLEPIVWSQFLERFLILTDSVFECPKGALSVLKAFKIVLDGSKCVCGGSKAVLVSKVPLLF